MYASTEALSAPWRGIEVWDGISAHLDIALQPIVNIHTGVVFGFEALLRGTDALGAASIGEFFDDCHVRGLLPDIEALIREMALTKFAEIEPTRRGRLFLNMDTRALDPAQDHVQRTKDAAKRHGIATSQVVLELSERHPFSPSAHAAQVLTQYKRAGFRLAIDDFGTGFAGLQMLYFSEPDFLKIDRFFVADIAVDARKRLFLAQIVHIAHLLNVVVVAEGVENEQEFAVCKAIGCDLLQGYLVDRPQIDTNRLKGVYDPIAALSLRERRKTVTDQKLVGDQIHYIPPLTLDTPMEQVFLRFRVDKTATFFPVIDVSGEPVGIVRESDLKTYAYSPFGKDLIRNRAYGHTLKDFVSHCPVADINTKAEHILEVYSAVENSEGIIIVDQMRYVGFLSAQSLLRIINEKNLAVARDQNPLTQLPGNTMIHDYVSRALAESGTEVVLVYFDFDNFKPFNDHYGFRLGDRAILMFAELLTKTVPRDSGFVGHVGGDDFFTGFKGLGFTEVQALCARLVDSFHRDVECFYDEETRRRGWLSGNDRGGQVQKFPLMSVSAALVHLPPGHSLPSVEEAGELIAVLKKQAKSSPDRLSSGSPV